MYKLKVFKAAVLLLRNSLVNLNFPSDLTFEPLFSGIWPVELKVADSQA